MSASHHLWARGWFITDPLCIGFLLFMFLYFILLEAYWAKTVGKAVMGIKIINMEGKSPGIKRSLIRNLLRVVDGLPTLNLLGIILITTSPQRSRFGDRIAGTRVIQTRNPINTNEDKVSKK